MEPMDSVMLLVQLFFNFNVPRICPHYNGNLKTKNDTFKAWFATYFGSIMKKEEETRMNATIPYMLSNAIVVLFFPPEFYFLLLVIY